MEPNFPFFSRRAQISAGAQFSEKLEPNFPKNLGAQFSRAQFSGHQFNSQFERHTILEEIVLNCVLFLLAGFDTTSNNLSLMAHYLVMYPEVQKRLFEEIEEVCGNGEEMPSYEELAKLKYADAVFRETQRLCPIAS